MNFNDPNLLVDDFTLRESSEDKRCKIEKISFSGKGIQNQLMLEGIDLESTEFLNSSIECSEEGLFIEGYLHEKCPDHTRKAFEEIMSISQKRIQYRKIKNVDRLWIEGERPKEEFPDGTQERERYLEAAKHIPILLKESEEIIVKPEQQKEFSRLKKQHKDQILWLKYYLCEDLSVLLELRSSNPSDKQYKPGKVSSKVYLLILDLWREAVSNKNPLCEWVFGFNSPAQMWFTFELSSMARDWDSKSKSSHQFYKEERLVLDHLKKYREKEKLVLVNDEAEMSFQQALDFSILRLLETGKEPVHFQEYLKARLGQANQFRNKKKRKGGFGGNC